MSPGSEEASARRHQGRDRKHSPQTGASESQTITPTGKSKRIFKREQMMPNTSGSILLLRCQICGYRRDVAKWGHLLSSRSFLGASQGFSFRKRRGSFFWKPCAWPMRRGRSLTDMCAASRVEIQNYSGQTQTSNNSFQWKESTNPHVLEHALLPHSSFKRVKRLWPSLVFTRSFHLLPLFSDATFLMLKLFLLVLRFYNGCILQNVAESHD